jgi:hypothetical protein
MQWLVKNQYRRSLTSFLRLLRDKKLLTPGKLRQTIFRELGIDTSTTARSPVFSTLLGPVSITTTANGALVIFFAASVTATAGVAAVFRIRVDGSAPSGIGSPTASTVTSPFNIQGAETAIYVPVAAGLHNVTIEWAKQSSAPLDAAIVINPASNNELFHANLIIMEVEI